MTLRPLEAADAPAVLALNEEVVHLLAPMDEATFEWFVASAELAIAAEVDGSFAGFVLVLAPGLAYSSANYRWFSERFQDFHYLDRVAVNPACWRTGVGTAIYEHVEAAAAHAGVPVLLEVNEVPPNEASLAFHARRGFRPIGSLAHDGDKVTRMLAWHPPA